MEVFPTIRSLVDAWPSRKDFAADVGVTIDRVQKWAQGNPIPARFWARMIRAAVARGIPLTADHLVQLHDEVEDARPEAAA